MGSREWGAGFDVGALAAGGEPILLALPRQAGTNQNRLEHKITDTPTDTSDTPLTLPLVLTQTRLSLTQTWPVLTQT